MHVLTILDDPDPNSFSAAVTQRFMEVRALPVTVPSLRIYTPKGSIHVGAEPISTPTKAAWFPKTYYRNKLASRAPMLSAASFHCFGGECRQ